MVVGGRRVPLDEGTILRHAPQVAAPLGLLLILAGSLWVTFSRRATRHGTDCAGRFPL
jgi:hypothetical protein